MPRSVGAAKASRAFRPELPLDSESLNSAAIITIIRVEREASRDSAKRGPRSHPFPALLSRNWDAATERRERKTPRFARSRGTPRE